MRRTRIKPRRATPRRREAPRWTWEEWQDTSTPLFVRAGNLCECCGGDFIGTTIERHHRKRRRDGGDRLSNVLLLRGSCHAHWTAHPREAVRRGIIVPTYRDPADLPVLHRGTTLVMLDDEGNATPCEAPGVS